MKNLLLLSFTALLFLSSCHKDDGPIAPIDQLPPATQTGAGTFACLVNGKPFIDNSGSFNCFYQFVDGGYYFGIGGDAKINNLITIGIGTYDKALEENKTYYLIEKEIGNPWGGGGFIENGTSGMYVATTSSNPGTLKITKLDFDNYIVSGTFSFDLVDPYTQKIIEIRQGRFDTFFTQ